MHGEPFGIVAEHFVGEPFGIVAEHVVGEPFGILADHFVGKHVFLIFFDSFFFEMTLAIFAGVEQ